jgi:flagellar motility protein MotE (MotC chaperone)
MKTALIRLLTLATLATSMSCFAATGDSKHDAAANTTVPKQQDGCADSAKHAKKQKQEKKTQDDQSEKDFDRVLMGIYG